MKYVWTVGDATNVEDFRVIRPYALKFRVARMRLKLNFEIE